MKSFARACWLALGALFLAAGALAQPADMREPARFSAQELDQMLAPVALYPDSLLSQLLMAATYPDDVADAARWSRANPGLQGDEAVRAVENEPWDPSVKSLVAFPQVLAMMDERLDWTARLGQAFLSQPEEVSDTVQVLRRRAEQAGTLRSSDEMVVRRYENDYVIEPASPEVVYVPYYDPRVAYGNWWWPDYPPVYWGPWSGYSWYPGYSGFAFGYGVGLGSGFFYSGFDWPRRYLRFYDHRPYYYRGWDRRHGTRWWHDRDGRRDARDRYRDRNPTWRDRDGRWRDRDGRWRDRDGRWRDRDDRRGDRRWSNDRRDGRDRASPRTELRQGDGSPVARESPRYRAIEPRSVPPATAPQARPAPQSHPALRAPPQAGVPLSRPAPQAPAVHSAPQPSAAPQERSSPVARPAVRESRQPASEPQSSPVERPVTSGGRRGSGISPLER